MSKTTSAVKAMRNELKRLAAVELNTSNAIRVLSDATREAGDEEAADVLQQVAAYLDVAAEWNAVRWGEEVPVSATDRSKFIEVRNRGLLLVEKATGKVFAVRAVWADSRKEEVRSWTKGKQVAASLAVLVTRMRTEIAAELVRVAVEEFTDAVRDGADLAGLRARLLADIGAHTAALAG